MKLYNLPFYGPAYRAVQRLLHRLDLHYMPVHHPIDSTSAGQAWCQWCGFRYTIPKYEAIVHARNPDWREHEKQNLVQQQDWTMQTR